MTGRVGLRRRIAASARVLAEILLWLSAPVSWASRRSGLLGRGVALWSRASRRRREWAPHMAASRAFVTQAFADLPRGGKALVLGSGLLQDVPVEALAAHFDEVILVDAAHLAHVRLAHAANRKLSFVERDLSGTASTQVRPAARRWPTSPPIRLLPSSIPPTSCRSCRCPSPSAPTRPKGRGGPSSKGISRTSPPSAAGSA